MKSTTGWGYRSAWNSLRPQLAELTPIIHAKRDKVVEVLMSAIRKRATTAANDHGLLNPYKEFDGATSKDQKLAMWSLADNEHGFARRLLYIFERDDLRPEEYEDMLEQKLFSLMHFAPGILQPRRSD
ncbi:hypothetical protein LTR36_002269 [Oleoguttula mirabilis]|uniref:Uncharacterized protein n=1 Tax=Oleoguttula mirabilis TaxID=1507867 RepID=A0AAV9JKW1_9PEZI|nr:hypothetical protein LTR36_002269 [Oleoguttula mirabilis]